jgi:hypothetical protein
LEAIKVLLARSVEAQEEDTEIEKAIRDLEKQRTETTSNLLEYTGVTNKLAEERTGMAKERTALVREQTRLSTKSTELSGIRTEMSRERTSLAGQRTDLAVLRTDLSRPGQASPSSVRRWPMPVRGSRRNAPLWRVPERSFPICAQRWPAAGPTWLSFAPGWPSCP